MGDGDLEADLRATLAARRELGEEYDAVLAKSFLERLDREVDAKVEQILATRQPPTASPPAVHEHGHDGTRLAIVSLILGIPVSAVVASNLHGTDSVIGVIVAWVAIAVINVVNAVDRRHS